MAPLKWIITGLSVTILSACGGGGGSSGSSGSSTPPPVVNQSLGGIWKSQYTVTAGTNNGDTINALAIATEQGDFVTIGKNANNGCASVGFGQGSVSGTTVSATADWGVVQYTTIPGVATNCIEPDGSKSGTTSANRHGCPARNADAHRHGHNLSGNCVPGNNYDMDV